MKERSFSLCFSIRVDVSVNFKVILKVTIYFQTVLIANGVPSKEDCPFFVRFRRLLAKDGFKKAILLISQVRSVSTANAYDDDAITRIVSSIVLWSEKLIFAGM